MRVLVVEDGKELADSIVAYFRNEKYSCELAHNLEQALEKIELHDYDCVLLDITLPDGNGLKVLERLKQKDKTEGLIIISAKDSLDDRIAGLKLGADDYLAKPFHLSELSARVEALIRRKNFKGSNKIVTHEISIDVSSHIVQINNVTVPLTRKEYDLLVFLVGNKGRIVSKNAIAEHLSGDMADMLDNHSFIYAHIKNLKKKLSEYGATDHVKTIYGFGYQWES